MTCIINKEGDYNFYEMELWTTAVDGKLPALDLPFSEPNAKVVVPVCGSFRKIEDAEEFAEIKIKEIIKNGGYGKDPCFKIRGVFISDCIKEIKIYDGIIAPNTHYAVNLDARRWQPMRGKL